MVLNLLCMQLPHDKPYLTVTYCLTPLLLILPRYLLWYLSLLNHGLRQEIQAPAVVRRHTSLNVVATQSSFNNERKE
jgi:hypothetical protein